jgi:CRISPR system Cascade subunit CasE
MDKALETWFAGKCERLGCAMVRDGFKKRLKFQAEGYQWHALPRKGKDAGFSSVDFEGEIEVMDAELFTKALFDGIGPAKGFGCGLMLVRRV